MIACYKNGAENDTLQNEVAEGHITLKANCCGKSLVAHTLKDEHLVEKQRQRTNTGRR